MIADINRRFAKILTVRVFNSIPTTRDYVNGPGSHAPNNFVKCRSRREKQRQQRQQGHPDNHLERNIDRSQHSANRKRVRARFSVFKMKPAVDDGRKVAGHGYHGNHTYHRHQAQRAQRRMLGKSQDANADEHDNGTEYNRIAVGMKNLLAGLVLVFQPLGNEDAVIVSHAKDKGGQDNVHYIELQPRQAHDYPDPDPAHRQRQEGNQSKVQRPKADP